MTTFVGIIGLMSAMQAPEQLTVDKAVEIAIQNSFAIRTAQSKRLKTDLQIKEAKGTLLPRVSLGGSITAYSPAISQGQGSELKDTRQASVQASVPVDLSGNLKRAIQGAKASQQGADADIETNRNDLRRDVKRAFYRVLQSQENLRINEQTKLEATERLRITKVQFEAGTAAKVDVLRAQVQATSADLDLATSTAALDLAKEALNNALGRQIDTKFEAQPVQEAPTKQIDGSASVETALSNRPEIKSLKQTLKVLELTTAIQKSGLQPSLNLSATTQHTFAPTGGSRENQSTGVIALSWPIWDNGITKSRVQQAKQTEEQTKIGIEQVSLAISLEVRQAITTYDNALRRLTLALENEKLAQEAFRLSNLRRDAGEGILLEVLNAQSDLTRARVSVVTARYDALSAFADLQRAMAVEN